MSSLHSSILRRIAIVCVTLAVGACATSTPPMQAVAVPPKFPIRDFFENPERAYFRLSEDGRTLGFMQPVAE